MPNGLMTHKFIDCKFRSSEYMKLLQETVVPIYRLNYENDFHFQEDNCSVHKAKIVRDFMENSRINILQWPSKSSGID